MIEKVIKELAIELDKSRIPYMVIGGQAVLLYGTPRLTRDIDITLGIDAAEKEKLLHLCSIMDLKALTDDPINFIDETNVLPVERLHDNSRIDFIFSFIPYERQAIERARKVLIDGYEVKYASPEDLIIHKLFAGRAIDDEDIKNILVKMYKSLDLEYLRKWLKEFTKVQGKEDISVRFEDILNKTVGGSERKK